MGNTMTQPCHGSINKGFLQEDLSKMNTKEYSGVRKEIRGESK